MYLQRPPSFICEYFWFFVGFITLQGAFVENNSLGHGRNEILSNNSIQGDPSKTYVEGLNNIVYIEKSSDRLVLDWSDCVLICDTLISTLKLILIFCNPHLFAMILILFIFACTKSTNFSTIKQCSICASIDYYKSFSLVRSIIILNKDETNCWADWTVLWNQWMCTEMLKG